VVQALYVAMVCDFPLISRTRGAPTELVELKAGQSLGTLAHEPGDRGL
jgi:hypothetical protein